MLDIHFIRQDPEAVALGLQKKQFFFDVAQFRQLDAARKEADEAVQALLAQRNQAAKEIGALIQSGLSVDQAKQTVRDTLASIEAQLDGLKDQAKQAQEALDHYLLGVPNLPDDGVPEGQDETSNREVYTWGEPTPLTFDAKDHLELATHLHGLDLEIASKITGSRFMVMRGAIARLHRALIQFMLDTHVKEHGYQEVYVPYIVHASSLRGTGQLPKFEDDLFKLDGDDDYYLIPTGEVPVTNMLRDSIVSDAALDKGWHFVSHTPCFRREAGSYGRDTRGIIRQHQFEKVELVQWVRPADSASALESLTLHAEAILQQLVLPYRKVELCGGDLSFAANRTYDLEVWLPGQQQYREISSCSGFGDFQARRMMARWRNRATGKPEHLHSLNGSGLAVGRTLVAVLENYQTASGAIGIPDKLKPYMGGIDEIQF